MILQRRNRIYVEELCMHKSLLKFHLCLESKLIESPTERAEKGWGIIGLKRPWAKKVSPKWTRLPLTRPLSHPRGKGKLCLLTVKWTQLELSSFLCQSQSRCWRSFAAVGTTETTPTCAWRRLRQRGCTTTPRSSSSTTSSAPGRWRPSATCQLRW